MDFSDWLNMLRLVFGQGVVKFFRSTPSELTLNCSLKRPFVISVVKTPESVVAIIDGHEYGLPWIKLLEDVDRLYNQ